MDQCRHANNISWMSYMKNGTEINIWGNRMESWHKFSTWDTGPISEKGLISVPGNETSHFFSYGGYYLDGNVSQAWDTLYHVCSYSFLMLCSTSSLCHYLPELRRDCGQCWRKYLACLSLYTDHGLLQFWIYLAGLLAVCCILSEWFSLAFLKTLLLWRYIYIYSKIYYFNHF